MTGSYQEISEACREQVDATIWLCKNNVFPNLEQYQEDYMREHLSNLVQTCVYVENKKPTDQNSNEESEEEARQLRIANGMEQ